MNADKANKKQPDKKTWNLFSLARRPGKGHSTKKKKIYIYICILLHRLLWWLWVALLLPFPPGSERALQAKHCCHESNLGGLTPTADLAWAELVQLQGSSPQRALLMFACSVVFKSLQPHELYPTRLLCPWIFPGKGTRLGCHFLLQGIFPTQG